MGRPDISFAAKERCRRMPSPRGLGSAPTGGAVLAASTASRMRGRRVTRALRFVQIPTLLAAW
eukprot:5549166-Alexandrium_andersonii.AAC.1